MDGRAVDPADAVVSVTDPGLLLGWTVFDSLVWPTPEARLEAHVGRLKASAAAALVPFPGETILKGEVRACGEAIAGAARVRITLTRGGRMIVTGERLDLSRWGAPVRAARGVHRDEPVLGGRVKHGSRAPWAVAVARSGVDDVLMVDADGRFTEGTTCGVVAICGGAVLTAPDDGRVLPSTTTAEILTAAAALGLRVVREGPPAQGPWEGLYVVSATRGMAPVVELDGVALAAGEPVGRALLEAIST